MPRSLPRPLTRLLREPPPELVFEVSPDSVSMARVADPQTLQVQALPNGTIAPSPVHENVMVPEAFNEAVRALMPRAARGKKRTAAILLPDHCAHVAILDFAKLPDNPQEQLSIIRFRLKRSVPFDVETAALSFSIQDSTLRSGGREVIAAVTALEIISRYEAPFRAAGLHPGFVTLAPLACLDLLANSGIVAVARLSGSVVTILVTQEGMLKVFRSIELSDGSVSEIAGHLHQTFVYVEDNLGTPAEQLLLAGFGSREAEALEELPAMFRLPVDVLGAGDTGIRGYLRGVAA